MYDTLLTPQLVPLKVSRIIWMALIFINFSYKIDIKILLNKSWILTINIYFIKKPFKLCQYIQIKVCFNKVGQSVTAYLWEFLFSAYFHY